MVLAGPVDERDRVGAHGVHHLQPFHLQLVHEQPPTRVRFAVVVLYHAVADVQVEVTNDVYVAALLVTQLVQLREQNHS